MRKFIVALFLVMLVSVGLSSIPWKPLKRVGKAIEPVKIAHAGFWGRISPPLPDGCFCYHDHGDTYYNTQISHCDYTYPNGDQHCYLLFCNGDDTEYCDAQCTKKRGECSGEENQCRYDSDCGTGRHCCKVGDHNECWDCPCNDPNCNGGGGGSGGGNGCDVTPPAGLSASPSYTSAFIAWTHGHNDHQELYLDTDKAKVDDNCANGCLLKLPAMGAARDNYTATGLQQGTTYYYKIVSVKDCGQKSAEASFTTLACDVTAPTGLHASPSYNYSILAWNPGHNAHQELYLDTDKARVDSNAKGNAETQRKQRRREKTTDYTD